MNDMTKVYHQLMIRKREAISHYVNIVSHQQIEIEDLLAYLHRRNSGIDTLKANITRLEEKRADYEKDREGYELELQDLRDKLEVRDGTIDSQDIEIENLKIKLKQKL